MPGVRRPVRFVRCLTFACALTIAGRFFHRCSVVDFERPSSDESVVEARRDPLPVKRANTLEYAVHGKFRTREGGAAFPDTVWFSLRELRAAGCSRASLHAAVSAYEESMAEASEEVLCELSETEAEDGESEGEGGDGAEAAGGGPEGTAVLGALHVAEAYGEEDAAAKGDAALAAMPIVMPS